MWPFVSGFFHFSIMFPRFICTVACISTLFVFIVKQYSIVWVYHIVLIYSALAGNPDCLHLLDIMNNDAMKTRV